MSNSTDTFVHESQDRFLEELKTFLRIPSISTLPEHPGDIDRAAGFVADSLRAAGLENVEVIPTGKHPLVYADDKGQMYMHVKAVETLRTVNGTLPVNVKFLIEGEEEVGGESIARYVANNPQNL